MGLDMYLYAELYVGGKFEHRNVKGQCKFTIGEGEHMEEYEIPLNTISSVTVDVGYWRKANAIHNWFVQNIQGGSDECQRSYVSDDQLKTLRSLCKEVLNDTTLAPKLLPVQEGFFFGSQGYDTWYEQNLHTTIDVIDKALKLPSTYDLYYQSSW